MKILICTILFLLPQKPDFQEKEYYAFAYFKGKENTLLYSDVVSFTLHATSPGKTKQELIKIQRTNTQRFIRFIRHRHPEAMPEFIYSSDANCLYVAETEEEALSMLTMKKSASEDSHKKIMDFPFYFPPEPAGPAREKN